MTELTSLSSRGQIVIPQVIREKLDLKEGEKFMVIGEDDTIVLKKFQPPSSLAQLLKETRAWAKENGVTKKDVDAAIKRARKK